jgi:hypothetical protein
MLRFCAGSISTAFSTHVGIFLDVRVDQGQRQLKYDATKGQAFLSEKEGRGSA